MSVEALDKMHACLDLLIAQKLIEPESTLKETYYKYLDIYKIERTAPDMWDMVQHHKIQSLFQMEQQSGIQGIALTHPTSVDDLAVLNSVIRLMAQEKDEEQPLNKYARFKENIYLWYAEMDKHGLSQEEQNLLKPIVGSSYGIAESQEKIMQLVQMPELGGFSLSWADSLRKAVAKKKPEEFLKLEKEFFDTMKAKHLSTALCNYVWKVLIAMSRGYSFNLSHTLAYSLVALQEMNLAYKFPIIFWNCACLITDSGGGDTDEEESDNKGATDYKKIAIAIGKMIQAGIAVDPPDINSSLYTFYPDVKNNKILYGLSGILNVGEDLINTIIERRPYSSVKDFYYKVKPNKQAMISLIKGGAFDSMEERKFVMAWYIWETCDKKKRITLQNMGGLIKYNLLPKDTENQIIAYRVYEFNRYLKSICKYSITHYKLDERALTFLASLEIEHLIEIDGNNYLLGIKLWDKIYQSWMDIFRSWMTEKQNNILYNLNNYIFQEDWNNYAKGTYSSWEMEVLCFYHHKHELAHLNPFKYGISDFIDLPENPVIAKSFTKNNKVINMYELHKICGTCIAKNKNKGIATILTTSGVVNVRFRKEYFALFDKQISERGTDGIKHVVERSWFNRGSMIIINGIRSGDDFIAKKYVSTPGHTLYKITEIDELGNLTLQTERHKGEMEEDEL